MSTITLTAPISARRGRTCTTRPSARPATTTRPAPKAQRARSSEAVVRPVRLTRRGRLAVTGLLASIGLVASLFAGGISLAGTDAERVPVRYVTVTPGATLWGIAGEVAPTTDRRDTVARILELNALRTSSVHPGQRIAVPAS